MKYFLIALCLTLFVSCKCTKTDNAETTSRTTTTTTTTTSDGAGDVMGIGGTFYAETIYGENATNSGARIVLDAKSNNVSGNGGCNDFSGEAIMNQGSVKMSKIVSTEMFCEDKGAMEKQFFKALAEAAKYEYQGKGITFMNAAGDQVMFVSPSAKM